MLSVEMKVPRGEVRPYPPAADGRTRGCHVDQSWHGTTPLVHGEHWLWPYREKGRGMAEYQKFRWNVVKCWSELQSRLFDLQGRGKCEGITDARFNAWHRGYTLRNFFASWSWRGTALSTAADSPRTCLREHRSSHLAGEGRQKLCKKLGPCHTGHVTAKVCWQKEAKYKLSLFSLSLTRITVGRNARGCSLLTSFRSCLKASLALGSNMILGAGAGFRKGLCISF